jgi:hypothetical protein
MGFLSSIVKGITGFATGGPVGAALSVGSDLLGGVVSNNLADNNAKTAFDRSLGASNTDYQRATADMRAAGLNPILAYSQGGASTPTASTAAAPDFSNVGTKAVQASTALSANKANVANTVQQTRVGQTTEQLQRTQAEKTIADTRATNVDTALKAKKLAEGDFWSGLYKDAGKSADYIRSGRAYKDAASFTGRSLDTMRRNAEVYPSPQRSTPTLRNVPVITVRPHSR